jgi:hypothetical protein
MPSRSTICRLIDSWLLADKAKDSTCNSLRGAFRHVKCVADVNVWRKRSQLMAAFPGEPNTFNGFEPSHHLPSSTALNIMPAGFFQADGNSHSTPSQSEASLLQLIIHAGHTQHSREHGDTENGDRRDQASPRQPPRPRF